MIDSSQAVSDYFNEVSDRITPAAEDQKIVADRAAKITDELTRDGRVEHVLVTGSTTKSTAIKDFSDIDILVSLRPGPNARRPEALDEVLRMAKSLSEYSSNVAISGNVVRIQFEDGPDVDVLVAFQSGTTSSGDQVYAIPSEDRRFWQPYAPQQQSRKIQEKISTLGKDFNSLIKVIKWWNCHHGRTMNSYRIETLACETFDTTMPEMPNALVEFFDAAVNSGLESTGEEYSEVLESRAAAEAALDEVQQGNLSKAMAYWGDLLGV
ncbi:MAG TPA: nucleotidyltransferase domain-containing protein [Bryobacteraceae bacterium]